ncbi:912_t:CDS:2, partial [Racocetra fulgida]
TVHMALLNMDGIDDCLESDQAFYIEITINLDTLVEEITSNISYDQQDIKQFIRENLVQRASELHRIIVSKELCGYETLTVDQVYFWWTHEASKLFRRHDDQYESAKLLLAEKGYEILAEESEETEYELNLNDNDNYLSSVDNSSDIDITTNKDIELKIVLEK